MQLQSHKGRFQVSWVHNLRIWEIDDDISHRIRAGKLYKVVIRPPLLYERCRVLVIQKCVCSDNEYECSGDEDPHMQCRYG
ncbi:hypothetical protein H5410_047829 [Solanum commersonii]|uniref:Uncharacterized protein n=1 Tax=Solanum commersonii TaxID=4109 RepID=A0A9J5XGB3_SOLCO|nr:hypothetical protein H5410_047829 [Solanum commersonii]